LWQVFDDDKAEKHKAVLIQWSSTHRAMAGTLWFALQLSYFLYVMCVNVGALY
jgi:hypothetical protein